MNQTILASLGDPVGLTVSIAPWPLSGPCDSTAMTDVESRVDSSAGTLVLSMAPRNVQAAPLDCLRRLMDAALPLVRAAAHATATFRH